MPKSIVEPTPAAASPPQPKKKSRSKRKDDPKPPEAVTTVTAMTNQKSTQSSKQQQPAKDVEHPVPQHLKETSGWLSLFKGIEPPPIIIHHEDEEEDTVVPREPENDFGEALEDTPEFTTKTIVLESKANKTKVVQAKTTTISHVGGRRRVVVVE
eukprot:PhM_4_TR8505/c0_g1_i1/m.84087